MLPDNLGQLFDTALAVSPSRPDTTFTFAEPDARVHRVANGLAGLGVRAALMFGNDWRFRPIGGKSPSIQGLKRGDRDAQLAGRQAS